MEKQQNNWGIIVIFMFSLFAVFSCRSSEDNSATNPKVNTPTVVQNTVTSGTWRITNFVDSGTDKTAQFSGYNFTFSANGTVSATNGTNNYSGTWTVSDTNSNDDNINDLHFVLAFSSPPTFANLSEDWNFQEKSTTIIKLVHVSGGNGGTDYLTFTKN